MQEYLYLSSKRITYFYSSKPQPQQFTLLVRGIPVLPGSTCHDTVERFFQEYHPSTYLSHSVVRRTNKLQSLVVSVFLELQLIQSLSLDSFLTFILNYSHVMPHFVLEGRVYLPSICMSSVKHWYFTLLIKNSLREKNYNERGLGKESKPVLDKETPSEREPMNWILESKETSLSYKHWSFAPTYLQGEQNSKSIMLD